MKKNSTSATVGFFRAIGAKNIRSHTQMPDALRARLPESEVVDVADHLNKEEYWGNLSKEELEAMGDKGSELIDTQALTHLACLWYSVNHEEDKDNRALLVLSSDEPAGTSGFLSG